MKILFQNQHFVILDKPANMLSVPGRFADDERPVVGSLLQQQLQTQVFPVHRLDFEVSGILLFALSAAAHSAANQWFEKKTVKKIYQALSAGTEPSEKKMQWKSKLLRGKKRTFESPAGKSALTLATFQKKTSQGLFWYLEPVTGRSHQLRYEMAKHLFPIHGDTLYGSQQTWPQGIALRACQIEFPPEAMKWDLPEQWTIPGLIDEGI